MSTIQGRLKEIIDYVISYVEDATDDWFRIKLEIINNCPAEYRRLFSRRHYSTKKHILNSFDWEVINYWQEKTGIKLKIDPAKLHPENYVHTPNGWRLIENNEQRKKEREKLKKTH
jgi:hypothetical protein